MCAGVLLAPRVSPAVRASRAGPARASRAGPARARRAGPAPGLLALVAPGLLALTPSLSARARGGQAPTFWEDYSKGDLGAGALSKWVPEDHPPSHPRCKLHDIDCDELFPWGKVAARTQSRHDAAPGAAPAAACRAQRRPPLTRAVPGRGRGPGRKHALCASTCRGRACARAQSGAGGAHARCAGAGGSDGAAAARRDAGGQPRRGLWTGARCLSRTDSERRLGKATRIVDSDSQLGKATESDSERRLG
jgi:hypothetical protein